jgi:hypothetical protein
MAKRTRGLRTARGFGKQTILPDPELMVFQLMTTLALNMASEKLSEFIYGTGRSASERD